jgi:hypothetical protein
LLLALTGATLFCVGALFGTLGVWGIDRAGDGAWLLLLMGLIGVGTGGALFVRAVNSPRPPGP